MSAQLGERLRIERARLHESQEVIAARVQMTASALSAMECGKSVPRSDHLAALADVYGVTMDYLYGRTEERR